MVNDVKLSFHPGDRIGLLGANGAGKSTLVKSLKGELPLLKGIKTDGKNLKVGYFSQHQVDDLNLDKSALNHIQDIDEKATESVIRNFLGGFNFRGDKVKGPITHFSGGEKARLALAIIAFQKPNLLLMDEPTNHLDMDMRQALTIALQEFGGAILLISHDRHLLVNTVDEFLIIDNGKLTNFNGDLEDYRKAILKGTTDFKQKEVSEEHNKNPIVKIDKKQARQIRAQISANEKTLKRLQRKLSETEGFLNSPESYTDESGPDLQSLLRNQAELTSQIELTEEEWLQLNTQLEN